MAINARNAGTEFYIIVALICVIVLVLGFGDQIKSTANSSTAAAGRLLSKPMFSPAASPSSKSAPKTVQSSSPKTFRAHIQNEWLTIGWDERLHIRTINDKPVMWCFFDRKPIPAWVRLSLATLACHNHPHVHFQILYLEDIDKLLTHIHPSWPYLHGNHKSDYFRARILDEYGGYYVDADTVGLQSAWSIFQKLEWYDIASHTWPAYNAAIATSTIGPWRAFTPIASKWVYECHRRLDKRMQELIKGEYKLGWGEVGGDALNVWSEPIIKKDLNFRYFPLNGEILAGQLVEGIKHWSDAMSKYSTHSHVLNETEVLFWHYSQVHEKISNLTLEAVFNHDDLLVEVMCVSMKICRADRANSEFDAKEIRKPRQFAISNSPPHAKDDPNLRAWIRHFMTDNKLGEGD